MKKLKDIIKILDDKMTCYIGEQVGGGWYFIGNKEIYDAVGECMLKSFIDCEIVEMYELPATKNSLGIILKGTPFRDYGIPKKNMVWDAYEFNKLHHLPYVERKNGINSISGALALRNAIYEQAEKSLIAELVRGKGRHPALDFIRSGTYNVSPETGAYIIRETKKQVDACKEFVDDFMNTNENEIIVPKDLQVKIVRKYVDKYELHMWWSERKGRHIIFKNNPPKGWR